jgi:tetratricopeptide (TPR) repeat protein
MARRCTKLFAALWLALVVGCSAGVAEKHWQLAESFESQGQFLRAIEEYSRIVNFGHRNPIAIKAQFQIAQIYERNLKDYPRAIRAYRDAYRRSDDKRARMRAQLAVATIYAEPLQNPLLASQEFKSLYEEYGKDSREAPEILLAFAKNLTDANQFAESADKYAEFRKNFPGHKEWPRSLLFEGHARLAALQPGRAEECFREVIEKYTNVDGYLAIVAEAYYGLGGALEDEDKLDAALTAYRKSLAAYPNPKVIELKIERVQKRKQERRL